MNVSDLAQVLADYEDEILEAYYRYFMTCHGVDLYKKFLLSPRGRRRMRTYLKTIRLALEGDLESFLTDQREASHSRALRGYEFLGVIDSPLYLKRAVRDVIWRQYSTQAPMLGRLMSDMGQLEAILDQARTVIAGRYLGLRDEALTRHYEYLAGLSELSAALSAGADPASVLQSASRLIAQVTAALHCIILLADEEVPEGATVRVVSDGEAAENADIRDGERMLAKLSGPLPMGHEAAAHVLCKRRSTPGLCTYYAPLAIGRRVAGVIRVTVPKENALSGEHVQLLAAMANSVALLLENSWLNRRLGTAAAPQQALAPASGEDRPSGVSEREYQVLQLVAQGCTNTEIARRLVIEVNTVKTHLRRIFERLGARDRANAVFIAVREGWLDLH
jgi:DNA-binding CsgD family transcriptional regulator